MVDSLPTLAAVSVLALVHIVGVRLTFLDVRPRSYWLSIAGGAAVAYVFLHILPELGESQTAIEESDLPGLEFLERHVYYVALAGLATFYGLERWLQSTKRNRPARPDGSSDGIFWVHIGSFAVYNGIIGHLLVHREASGYPELLAFTIAMTFHFIANDHSLRQHHEDAYRDKGRWLLATAVLTGWIIGSLTDVGDATLGVLFAFLAGGVIMNVMKDELPERQESTFLPFALGASGYGLLLVLAG